MNTAMQAEGITLACIVVPACLFVLFAPANWFRKVFFDWHE